MGPAAHHHSSLFDGDWLALVRGCRLDFGAPGASCPSGNLRLQAQQCSSRTVAHSAGRVSSARDLGANLAHAAEECRSLCMVRTHRILARAARLERSARELRGMLHDVIKGAILPGAAPKAQGSFLPPLSLGSPAPGLSYSDHHSLSAHKVAAAADKDSWCTDDAGAQSRSMGIPFSAEEPGTPSAGQCASEGARAGSTRDPQPGSLHCARDDRPIHCADPTPSPLKAVEDGAETEDEDEDEDGDGGSGVSPGLAAWCLPLPSWPGGSQAWERRSTTAAPPAHQPRNNPSEIAPDSAAAGAVLSPRASSGTSPASWLQSMSSPPSTDSAGLSSSPSTLVSTVLPVSGVPPAHPPGHCPSPLHLFPSFSLSAPWSTPVATTPADAPDFWSPRSSAVEVEPAPKEGNGVPLKRALFPTELFSREADGGCGSRNSFCATVMSADSSPARKGPAISWEGPSWSSRYTYRKYSKYRSSWHFQENLSPYHTIETLSTEQAKAKLRLSSLFAGSTPGI